ncbi:MAG: hypothetical protein GOU99_03310, partial [Candidatus Altiarchaeota archaeon]|nr:hypothetical protein [Candidatus Altiarchaeota archaeon]
ASNNMGAILGSLLAGFVFIQLIGIRYTLIVAGILNLTIGMAFLKKPRLTGLLAITTVFLVFSTFAPYDLQKFYTKGFFRALSIPEDSRIYKEIVFHKEGLYATVNVIEEGGEIQSLLINGKSQSGTAATDLRVNYLLAYLPLMLHENPQNALVLGLGTGATAGQLAAQVKTTILEIEPAVADAASYFNKTNLDVLNNPQAELIIDDARNYLLRSEKKFDLIIPELCDPWQDISTMFYSQEFFELGKEHLSQDGLFVQWVPIYLMEADTFKSFYATFESVFPNTAIFANIRSSERDGPYPTEMLFVGSESPIELENIAWRFYLMDISAQNRLTEIIFQDGVRPRAPYEDTPDRVASLLLSTSDQMAEYAKGAQIVTDDNLLLEFASAKKVLKGTPMDVLIDLNRFLGGSVIEG